MPNEAAIKFMQRRMLFLHHLYNYGAFSSNKAINSVDIQQATNLTQQEFNELKNSLRDDGLIKYNGGGWSGDWNGSVDASKSYTIASSINFWLTGKGLKEVEITKFNNSDFKQCLTDFISHVEDKRMVFWKNNPENDKKWVSCPEQKAKELMVTFLYGKYGNTFHAIEEVNAGAGRIDIYIVSPQNEQTIIELKMCGHGYSQSYAQEGQEQLLHYMKNKKVQVAYLVIFDSRIRDFGMGFQTQVIDDMSIIPLVADVRPYVKIPKDT